MGSLRKTLVAMSMLAFTGVASAQDEEPARAEVDERESEGTPLNYVRRPLTLRQRTLRADAAPGDFGLMDSGAILGPVGSLGSYGIRVGQVRSHGELTGTSNDTFGTTGLGASYGVVDRLEVGVLLLPINFESGNGFGNIAFYARAALVAGEKFSLGLQGTVSLPTQNDVGFGAGLPINVRLGDSMRLETGVEGEFFLDTEDDSDGTKINVDVPFALSHSVGQAGFLGGRTGGTLVDVGGFNITHVPVGAIGGCSFTAGSVLVDIKGSATWTFVIDPNVSFRQSIWAVMLGASVHLDL